MSRVFINVGPITIYWYSITMLLAILSGIYLADRESRKMNISSYFQDLLVPLIISGIIGARLYYVIFNFSVYKNDLLSIFKIWEGGLAIYGAIIAGFLTILYYAKKNKQSILKTIDLLIPSLILAQAIGRWGNFFNQEAHGPITSLEFLEKLHLPNFIINGMYINGSYYQPTFLYESIWCLIGFIIIILIRKISKRKTGLITTFYFIWYGLGRLFIEGIRTDSLYLGKFRVSQIVSIILIIIGIVGTITLFIKDRKIKKERKNKNDKKI